MFAFQAFLSKPRWARSTRKCFALFPTREPVCWPEKRSVLVYIARCKHSRKLRIIRYHLCKLSKSTFESLVFPSGYSNSRGTFYFLKKIAEVSFCALNNTGTLKVVVVDNPNISSKMSTQQYSVYEFFDDCAVRFPKVVSQRERRGI